MIKFNKKTAEPIEKLVAVIYGDKGVGKTQFCIGAPKPFLFDIERGLARIQNEAFYCDNATMDSYSDIKQTMESENFENYDTLIFDTLGSLVELIYDYSKEQNIGCKDGRKIWGETKSEFKAFLARAIYLKKHLIFVAHSTVKSIGNLGDKITLEVAGSSGNALMKDVSLIGHMRMFGDKRVISFDPCGDYDGKNSFGINGIKTIPTSDIKNDSFNNIIMKGIEEYKKNREISGKAYNKAITEGVALIEKTDATNINKTIENLANINHFGSSKVVLFASLTDKATALGFIWDPQAKRFVDSKSMK
jgi:hypothetical protein